MYQHILVPTDGSKLATKAIRSAAKLAKGFGAKLTGVYVIPPYVPPMYSEGAMYAPAAGPEAYRKLMEREAKKALAAVEVEAQTAGIGCKTASVTSEQPWQGIIRVAKAKHCDLIVMASHGRRGLAGLLLGSETTKVLTHSKTPVLVCR